jgi:hypothetical protein
MDNSLFDSFDFDNYANTSSDAVTNNINIESSKDFVEILKKLILKNEELEASMKGMVEEIQNIKEQLQEHTLTLSSPLSSSSSSCPTTIVPPVCSFKDLPDKINIRMQHIESLKDCTITQVMIGILEEMQPPLPMLCFTHKLYVYSAESTWRECSNDELVGFLNKLHQKFVKEMCEWYSANKEQINESDQMSISYNKMMIKLMGIDFKSKGTLSKIKSKLCKYLKTL